MAPVACGCVTASGQARARRLAVRARAASVLVLVCAMQLVMCNLNMWRFRGLHGHKQYTKGRRRLAASRQRLAASPAAAASPARRRAAPTSHLWTLQLALVMHAGALPLHLAAACGRFAAAPTVRGSCRASKPWRACQIAYGWPMWHFCASESFKAAVPATSAAHTAAKSPPRTHRNAQSAQQAAHSNIQRACPWV